MSIPKIDPANIKIRQLFPTPFASISIPDAANINASLAQIILKKAKNEPSRQHSNTGGWQSPDDFATWEDPAAQTLLGFATDLANILTATNSPQGLMEGEWKWKVNAWANVNNYGCSNALHGHPASFWSSVYWVDDGGRTEDAEVDGDFEVLDPRGFMPAIYPQNVRINIDECLSAGYNETMAPSSGTLIMFPSWLLHSVHVFKGNRPRISIAFNFTV